MDTLIFVVAGLALLAVLLWCARVFGKAILFLVFYPLWFVCASINLWIGVTQAGYSFAEELPIFLLIFGLPAVAAAWMHKRTRAANIGRMA